MTDEGKPVEHPAKFSDPIIEAIAPYVLECDKILDCFGGVGKIDRHGGSRARNKRR